MLSSPDLRWEILEAKYGASKDTDMSFLYVCCFLLCGSFILYLWYFTLIPGLRILEWIRQPFCSGEIGKQTSKQAVAIQVTWHNEGKLSLWERSLLWWPRLWSVTPGSDCSPAELEVLQPPFNSVHYIALAVWPSGFLPPIHSPGLNVVSSEVRLCLTSPYLTSKTCLDTALLCPCHLRSLRPQYGPTASGKWQLVLF